MTLYSFFENFVQVTDLKIFVAEIITLEVKLGVCRPKPQPSKARGVWGRISQRSIVFLKNSF